MTVINPNRSAILPVGSQHPTTSAHPSSTIIIRRTGSRYLKTHVRYFLADGNLDIELDDGTLYRVHRHFFTQYSSAFAAEYLSSPASSSFVRLRSIEGRDFDRLLSLIYPSKLGELDISTADEWLSVLRLADRWSFVDLRQLAREKLDSIASATERAAVACELGLAGRADSARPGLPKVATVNTPERSGSSDRVDAADNLQRVPASIRVMPESNVEDASLTVEDASPDIGDRPAPLGATPMIEATYEPMALHTAPEPSRVTRELVSTIDFLHELPFCALEQPDDTEPAHSSNLSEAPARHRESIQDRLKRVLGKEPPKRVPSLWSSFRSSTSDFSDGAPSSSNAPAVRSEQDPAAESDNLDSCSSSSSLGTPKEPFLAEMTTKDASIYSGRNRVSNACQPAASSASDSSTSNSPQRVASSSSCVTSPFSPSPLDVQDHPPSSGELTGSRDEWKARYREELMADIVANTERMRHSMNRVKENASRWMDIFGRTTYSSAFYE
ncbi:uncharacterized protein SCHCODRAFT_02627827 [Schizophyllum commune H4-8]|uniref:Expressed protein n=1 Tax=Schizophyllum commune (strain H4-8 / FGSC 9210) TaxID=578458 RepID=D8Q6E2_SCHCM|nr:uncharacterized protein SCHCODRAFT_02627827 [Schizophyllum commune H4-8]KAI5890985.1 hypothetical protein SCHCODRAFT_02627827 [Schizophyllum commune H4-8]